MKKLQFKIKQIIDARGISMNNLSLITQVSYPTIDRMCKNKLKSVDISILQKISHALNLPVGELFEEVDETGGHLRKVA